MLHIEQTGSECIENLEKTFARPTDTRLSLVITQLNTLDDTIFHIMDCLSGNNLMLDNGEKCYEPSLYQPVKNGPRIQPKLELLERWKADIRSAEEFLRAISREIAAEVGQRGAEIDPVSLLLNMRGAADELAKAFETLAADKLRCQDIYLEPSETHTGQRKAYFLGEMANHIRVLASQYVQRYINFQAISSESSKLVKMYESNTDKAKRKLEQVKTKYRC